MQFLRHQIRTGWRAEAAILACAALLAFGTLAWMEMVHVRVLGEALTAGGSHFLRDGLLIHPGVPHAARIATYDDHRMAMSFALLALRTEGIEIEDPDCVSKTYPGYFADLEAATGVARLA